MESARHLQETIVSSTSTGPRPTEACGRAFRKASVGCLEQFWWSCRPHPSPCWRSMEADQVSTPIGGVCGEAMLFPLQQPPQDHTRTDLSTDRLRRSVGLTRNEAPPQAAESFPQRPIFRSRLEARAGTGMKRGGGGARAVAGWSETMWPD